MQRLLDYMEANSALVEKGLGDELPKPDISPSTLHEAMRYSILRGGKRIRPLLVMMFAGFGSVEPKDALAAGIAVEFVHGYSLIHDDLPAMDNDDMRRGRLTCHKAYDEATAILAGDALLTLAFEHLSESYTPRKALGCIRTLARSAGHLGMVGGQMLDLEAEKEPVDEAGLREIHIRKTGALIAACCRMGGIIAELEDEQLDKVCEYGRQLGLLFQITDDMLDVTATAEELGKTPGKDLNSHKCTYVSFYGVEKSAELAKAAATKAKEQLKEFGAEALMPRLMVDYVLERKN